MSRTVITVKTNASRDSVLQYLSVELPRLGYTDRSTPTERIWGKNDGVMVKGQRISVNFQPGKFIFPPGFTTPSWGNPICGGSWPSP